MEDNSDLEDFPVTLETIKFICGFIEEDTEALRHWMIFIRRLDYLTPADIRNLSEKNRKDEDIRIIIAESLELWIGKSKENATFLRFLHFLEEEKLRNLKHNLYRAYDLIKEVTLLGIKNEKLRPNVSSAGSSSADVHQTAIKWNVTQKNTNFIGRRVVLEKLSFYFSDKQDYALLGIIYGLGGIGKSSTALEYVWTNLSKYSRICWFHAETREKLFSDYEMLARTLLRNHVDDQAQPNSDELLTLLKQWFEDPKNSGWLLVYDNCSTYDDIVNMLPVSGGNILITSRYSIWHEGKTFELCKFDLAETKAYVHKILGEDIPMSDIEALGQEFDHFPLAIAQAFVYIKYGPMTIPEYLETYRRSKEKWLAKNSLPKDYNVSSVLFTWKLSMEKIEKELPLAARWIEIMCCLDGDRIPHELLEIFIAWTNNNLEADDYCDVLITLAKFSMIKVNREGKFSTIHRLVQEVIYLSQEGGRRKELCVTSFLILTSAAAPILYVWLPTFPERPLERKWALHWIALLKIAQGIKEAEPALNSITLAFTSTGIKPLNCRVPSVKIEIQFLVRLLRIFILRSVKSKNFNPEEAEMVKRACVSRLQQFVELLSPVFGENSLVVANCNLGLARLAEEPEETFTKLEDFMRIYSAEYNGNDSSRHFDLMFELALWYITKKELNNFHKGLEVLTNAREYFECWNEIGLASLTSIRHLFFLFADLSLTCLSKFEVGKELAKSLQFSLKNMESWSGLAYTILILAIEIEAASTPVLLDILDRASAEPAQGKKTLCEIITSLTSGQQYWNVTPLFYAVICDCHEAIKILLTRYGVDPAFQTDDGNTVLHYACLYSPIWCKVKDCEEPLSLALLLDFILQKFESSDVTKILNLANIYGSTPLICMVVKGNEIQLKTLLEKSGAFLELDKADNHKRTPLAIAIGQRRNIGMVKLLVEAGASLTGFNDHDSILHQTVRCENEEILTLVSEFLIQATTMKAITKVLKTEAELEQNFNPCDTEGDTPLMWAAENGRLSQARLLLKEKTGWQVKLDLKIHDGIPALDWASVS